MQCVGLHVYFTTFFSSVYCIPNCIHDKHMSNTVHIGLQLYVYVFHNNKNKSIKVLNEPKRYLLLIISRPKQLTPLHALAAAFSQTLSASRPQSST